MIHKKTEDPRDGILRFWYFLVLFFYPGDRPGAFAFYAIGIYRGNTQDQLVARFQIGCIVGISSFGHIFRNQLVSCLVVHRTVYTIAGSIRACLRLG